MRRRQTGRAARDIQGIGTGCRASVLCLALLWGCTGTVIDADPTATSDEQQSPRAIKMHYKIGTPYAINGLWYYPKVDYAYDESGIASWYGKKFDARPTANGEFFDPNGVTAAHRTLPLPSIVRVTNLENGRVLVVRVNDRGPFVRGRLIDLSRQSARLLGFENQGLARVRVQILPMETRLAVASMLQSDAVPIDATVPDLTPSPMAVPVRAVAVKSLAAIPGSRLAPPRKRPSRPANRIAPDLPNVAGFARRVRTTPHSEASITQTQVKPTQLFVQAATFVSSRNAANLVRKLSDIGPTQVQSGPAGRPALYQVRFGPLDDVKVADRILRKVLERGFPGARIVVE